MNEIMMTDNKNDLNWYEDIREIRDIKELLNGSAKLFADRPAFWIKKFKGDEYHMITYEKRKRPLTRLMLSLSQSASRCICGRSASARNASTRCLTISP